MSENTAPAGGTVYRFKQWLGDVPIVSLALLKLCPCGGSVVEAQWRWRRCSHTPRSVS